MRFAGQTFYTHIEGDVFDASTIFTGPETVAQFKELIFEELAVLTKPNPTPTQQVKTTKPENDPTSPQESVEPTETSNTVALVTQDVQAPELTEIEKARVAFENFDFTSTCRVLILEENISKTKHLIIQVGRLHTLAEYATYTVGRHWNFVVGQTSLGKVDGLGLTFPHEWKLPEIGKVLIHLFCPDDPRNSADSKLKETLADAKALTAIVPWIPQALNVQEHLRALRGMLRQREDAMALMRDDIIDMRTRLDAADVATATIGADGKPLPPVSQKSSSLLTILCYGLPIIIFGIVGSAFPPSGWFFGNVLGLFAGAFADFFVKRR